jgi:hypothetical protein
MIRRLQGDKIRKLIYADLAARASQGVLQPGALSEILERVEGKGEDMQEVIKELDRAGRLTAQPQAPPAMPGAPAGPGGGIGPATSGVLPALETFRR